MNQQALLAPPLDEADDSGEQMGRASTAKTLLSHPPISSLILAVRDEERRRLAQDLHDGLQQQLVVLRMRLGALSETALLEPRAKVVWEELKEEVDSIIERLRELSRDTFPPILADRGLAAALRSYLGRFILPVRFFSNPDPLPRTSPEVEASAYFIVLEATTNALKHAAASQLEISLELEGDFLEVRVKDDGRGFDPNAKRDGRGLGNMWERARALDGDFFIFSRPGRGTEILARLGIDRANVGDGCAPRCQLPRAAADCNYLAGVTPFGATAQTVATRMH